MVNELCQILVETRAHNAYFILDSLVQPDLDNAPAGRKNERCIHKKHFTHHFWIVILRRFRHLLDQIDDLAIPHRHAKPFQIHYVYRLVNLDVVQIRARQKIVLHPALVQPLQITQVPLLVNVVHQTVDVQTTFAGDENWPPQFVHTESSSLVEIK